MALVGDVILSSRELMTDLPQALGTPGIVSATPVNVTGGGLAPGFTFFAVVTALNQWGESLPSAEISVAITPGNNAIQFLVFVANMASVPIIGYNIYVDTASGAEHAFQFVPGNSTTIVFTGNASYATPPTRSTAYLPDTDGGAVGVSAIYRWLNQALAWAAGKNRGGLPDFGAAGTTGGQPNYVMPGYWKKIDTAWYDGYPLGLLNKNNVFRRQPVTGYSGSLTVFQATDRLMVELWPQPNRTSGNTTLSAPMTAVQNSASLVSASGYVLGFGLTQIGSEIVNFAAVQGNSLTGLQRGMSGTTPVAHLAGEPVTELNLMISGYRVPSTYSVGQSASTLYLPPGWDEALVSYILYRFRSAEQDDAAANRYLKEATQKMSDLSANKIIAGPRQITPYNAIGPEVGAGLGTAFGGVIIP